MADILLAEDDEAMRVFLARALRQAGHRVVAVSDGAQALEHANTEEFELLLTDVVMPELDGIELARQATLENEQLKVIFITGFAAVAVENRDGPLRETQVISKPFHLRDLVTEVERTLAA